ncbi:Rv2175c family DNA-binding protein [Pedococcus sp. P5_B7]
MTEQPAASTAQSDYTAQSNDTAESVDAAQSDAAEPSLETLVGSWLTVPDVAERMGIALSAVRRLIEERELLSARIGERRVVAVPEQFLHEDVFRHLRGTFTVLGDGGLDDDEILRWLFTPDPTLRVPGTPVDNLAAGFKTEVRRRAMEQAF